VAGELTEQATPREVHFVAGHPMTVNGKIDKQPFRARCLDS
jgi:acyl-coenzyme A synthetase/AMP-(fatty) acid ligase